MTTTLTGLRTIDQLELSNQRVLVRIDLDCPLDTQAEQQELTQRTLAVLPTLRHIAEKEGKIVAIAHRGRPKGRTNTELGLEPMAVKLAELTGWDVILPDDCLGDAAKKAISDLRSGQMVLLENLRFYADEEAGDEGFALKLSAHGDVYVNDALAASNRPHSSVYQLPKLFRERAMGLALQKELDALLRFNDPQTRVTALLGGTRLTDRVRLIESLLLPGRTICIGGALGCTLLAARGTRIGMTKIENSELARARTLLDFGRDRNVTFILPSDVMVSESDNGSNSRIVPIKDIGERDRVVDIGPDTVETFRRAIEQAQAAFWVGAMGSVGQAPFASGTFGVAKALAGSPRTYSVVLGSAALGAAQKLEPEQLATINHVSMGAGAALELLEGKKLPGIEVLRTAE
jgi:phosphoglycerate kinase